LALEGLSERIELPLALGMIRWLRLFIVLADLALGVGSIKQRQIRLPKAERL
jgi:hypothetical protein